MKDLGAMTTERKEKAMRALELKDIFGYLPYDLKVYDIAYENREEVVYPVFGIEMNEMLYHCSRDGYDWWNINSFKPILRPLSDLYRAITHEGKEIVPIVECAKLAISLFKDFVWKFDAAINGAVCYHGDYATYFCLLKSSGYIQLFSNEFYLDQIRAFDFLHELKIDYRGLINEGLAVDVHTLKINPYK